MKEILMKFNMDVLMQSEHLMKIKGQPLNTYANGVSGPGYDLINLNYAIESCYKRLGITCDRIKVWEGDREGDEGSVFCGSRDFGDETLRVVVKVTSEYYDTYMPEHSKYLLKETKWDGRHVTYGMGPHICGDGGEDKWKYKNIVLNNVVYPCHREGERHWEMYYDAVNALYDYMNKKVSEMCIKHGYGDISERKAVPVEICSMAEFNEMVNGKKREDFKHKLFLIFGDGEKPDDPEEMRNFYYKIPDIKYDELEEYGYTYEDFWPEAEHIARIIYFTDRLEKVVCVSENGKSRSAGCAAAISDYFLKDGIKWFADEKYTPNKLIYRKMKEALEKIYKEYSQRQR